MLLPECVAGYTGTPQTSGPLTSTFPCVPCPQGTYKKQLGWFECANCPKGTTTQGTGHTSANNCLIL